MTVSETQLERALGHLLECATDAPAAREELAAARARFGVGERDSAAAPATPAARRAEEWFVLERPSAALGGVPIELAMHGALELDEVDEDALAALAGSTSSVFEVTGVQSGEGVWVRDLFAFGEYPLHEPEGSHTLAEGDLLVGRVFPVGEGLHRVSRGAGVFRSPELKRALQHDLEQARGARRGVLRLAATELERMFWGPSAGEERQRARATARAVLVRGGLTGERVDAIFARLRATPFAGDVLPGGGDELGAILGELAFDTQVDLDLARQALLELWPLEAGPATPAPTTRSLGSQVPEPRRASPDARAAIAAFDRGRAAGRDLEELFRELERDLELELDPDADPDADDVLDGETDAELTAEEFQAAPKPGAPDVPGEVPALVEEYLWELGREAGDGAARAAEGLRRLSTYAGNLGALEDLGARELLAFAALWLPEYGELADERDVRALLSALESFCSWLDEHHAADLAGAYRATVAGLEDELPRIVAANRHRSPSSDPAAGELRRVESVDAGRAVFSGPRGHETRPVDARLARQLRPGDLVRAAPEGPDDQAPLAVYCVYPAAAGDLARVGQRR